MYDDLIAAVLAEMQRPRGTADFEVSRAALEYSTCMMQGSVEALDRWLKLVQRLLSSEVELMERARSRMNKETVITSCAASGGPRISGS